MVDVNLHTHANLFLSNLPVPYRTFKTICIRHSKISYSVLEENYTYIAQIILNYPNDEAANSRSGMLTF